MKPLLLLLVVFTISIITNKLIKAKYNFALSGRIAMAAMLIFTGIAHFIYTEGMEMMLPTFIPYKTAVVYLTGIIEFMFAIALFIPKVRVTNAWLLIIFFILILPANIYATIKQVDLQKATFNGNGLSYLWFRIPLQLFFIGWVYFSSIKKSIKV